VEVFEVGSAAVGIEGVRPLADDDRAEGAGGEIVLEDPRVAVLVPTEEGDGLEAAGLREAQFGKDFEGGSARLVVVADE
jgi:hypothetical protein